LIELSTTHARRQLEMMTDQAKEITDAAQKLMTESTTQLTSGVTKTFGQMS
jgi:hypothetical protein